MPRVGQPHQCVAEVDARGKEDRQVIQARRASIERRGGQIAVQPHKCGAVRRPERQPAVLQFLDAQAEDGLVEGA